MRALYEQTSQLRIPGPRDPELGIGVARLMPLGPKTDIGADRPALREPGGIVDREDEGERRERSDAVDGSKMLDLGIALLGDGLDPAIKGPDLIGQHLDRVEDRRERILKHLGDLRPGVLRKLRRAAARYASADRLDRAAHVVDQLDP